jgi:DNA-binding transcriptional LysR family regulator
MQVHDIGVIWRYWYSYMNGFDWGAIEVFLRVAEAGSFTAAAEELGTSQPTVSRQVHALEERLGVTLFARHARGFELTERGEALLETARRVESGVQTFVRRAEGARAEIGGAVRLSASEPVAAYLLMPFFERFAPRHPEIELEVVAEMRASNLLRREADIAVRMFRPEQLDLRVRRIGELPIGLFAHRSYLERAGRPTRPEELAGHMLIGDDVRTDAIDALGRAGLDVERGHFRLRSDSLVVQIEAIRGGVGIGGTQVAIGRRLAGVERVLPELVVAELPVWLAMHRDLRHSPTIRAVFEGLAEYLAEEVV